MGTAGKIALGAAAAYLGVGVVLFIEKRSRVAAACAARPPPAPGITATCPTVPLVFIPLWPLSFLAVSK